MKTTCALAFVACAFTACTIDDQCPTIDISGGVGGAIIVVGAGPGVKDCRAQVNGDSCASLDVHCTN